MTVYVVDSRFPTGKLSATSNALAQISEKDIQFALFRHSTGDWGDLDEADRAANEAALREDKRLLSQYTDEKGTPFWIITEWDRSATIVLLPEDY